MRTSSFLLALVRQHPVRVERGCTSPAQSSGISVYLGSAGRQKIPSVCTQAMALNNLAHPLWAAWSHPGHLGWVPQSIPLTIVAPQTRRLCCLHKACPRKITERGLILWRLAVNLHFPKMFKSHWKHKGKTAENCWLLSDCSLKTPPCIKEENIAHCKLTDLTSPGMSFGVRQFHVSQTSAQKPRKKMTPVQKNPDHKYLFSWCQEGCTGSVHWRF